jgi:hypothetical protein
MTTYKLSDVKQVCEAIYDRPIVDRTWRKWKASLSLPKYVKEISQAQMEQLLTLANLKRSKPYDKVTLTQVIKSKQATLKEFQEARNNYTLYLIPDECRGDSLPEVIRMVTGRQVSLKSLYRWGKMLNKHYSSNSNYTKDEVLLYISQTLIKPRAKKAARYATSVEP